MKKLILPILALTSTLVQAVEELPQFARNLMIFFDTSERIIKENFEGKQEDIRPFGAITTSALAALHQKAGPILITQTCLRNCVLPNLVKRDFSQLSSAELQNRYPFLTPSNYLVFEKAIANPTSMKEAYREFIQAALINFNYDDWIIRKVLKNSNGTITPSDDLYLLIPRTYLPGLLKDYKNSSSATTQKITDLEYKLGIKIDHMGPTIKNKFETAMYKNTTTSKEEILESFDKSLFFTLNAEYAKANKSDQIPQWALYITGHGLGTKTQSDLEQLQQTADNAQQLHDTIKKYVDQTQKMYPDSEENRLKSYNTQDFRDSLQKLLGLIKKINNELRKDFPSNSTLTLIALQVGGELSELEVDIELSEKELKKKRIEFESNVEDILDAFEKQKGLVEILYKNKLGVIAGIPLLAFQEFLDFLDTKINTQFLFFSSCYAGGRNLQLLYQKSLQEMQGRTYSYIIASNAFTDAPSSSPAFIVSNGIIKFSENFKDFFEIINNLHKQSVTDQEPFKSLITKAIEKLTDFISQAQKGYVSEIPNLKFPGLEFTQVPNLPEIVSIGQILATTHDPKKQLDLQKFFRIKNPPNVVLLYAPVIPFSIKLTKPKEPNRISFISMTPGKLGKAYHIFEELDAQEFTFVELSQAFFVIEKLESEKVFWIKQAKLKNNETIKDIFFVQKPYNIGPIPTAYYTQNNIPYRSTTKDVSTDYGYKDRWKKYLSDTFGPNYDKPTKSFEQVRKIFEQKRDPSIPQQQELTYHLQTLAQSLQSLARSL